MNRSIAVWSRFGRQFALLLLGAASSTVLAGSAHGQGVPGFSGPAITPYPSTIDIMQQRNDYQRTVRSNWNSYYNQLRTTAPGYDGMARGLRGYARSRRHVYRSQPTRSSQGWSGGRRGRVFGWRRWR